MSMLRKFIPYIAHSSCGYLQEGPLVALEAVIPDFRPLLHIQESISGMYCPIALHFRIQHRHQLYQHHTHTHTLSLSHTKSQKGNPTQSPRSQHQSHAQQPSSSPLHLT